MLSAALKVSGDVTAADDALDFLVSDSVLLAEVLLTSDGDVRLREHLLLSRSSQSQWQKPWLLRTVGASLPADKA
jgi:hypothetical protein